MPVPLGTLRPTSGPAETLTLPMSSRGCRFMSELSILGGMVTASPATGRSGHVFQLRRSGQRGLSPQARLSRINWHVTLAHLVHLKMPPLARSSHGRTKSIPDTKATLACLRESRGPRHPPSLLSHREESCRLDCHAPPDLPYAQLQNNAFPFIFSAIFHPLEAVPSVSYDVPAFRAHSAQPQGRGGEKHTTKSMRSDRKPR